MLENRRAFGDTKDTSPKNCIQPVTRVETRQLFLKTRLAIYRKIRELIILKKDGIRWTFCSVLISNGASCYVFSRNFSYHYQEPPDLLTYEFSKIKSSFVNSLESPSDAENCETIPAFSKRYRSGEFGLRIRSDHVQPQKRASRFSWIRPLSAQNRAYSRDSLPAPQCSNLGARGVKAVTEAPLAVLAVTETNRCEHLWERNTGRAGDNQNLVNTLGILGSDGFETATHECLRVPDGPLSPPSRTEKMLREA